MTAARAIQSIAFEVLQRVRARVAPGERGRRCVQCLIDSCQERRERFFDLLAGEFAAHPDFPGARAESPLWGAILLDGRSKARPRISSAAVFIASSPTPISIEQQGNARPRVVLPLTANNRQFRTVGVVP